MIKESIDSGKFGCGIFIDFRKAFDTVNHEILLTEFEHYGIRDNMLHWFKSYLSNRRQYVTINGKSSESLEIYCGVLYPKDQSLVHYYSCYILMTYQILVMC